MLDAVIVASNELRAAEEHAKRGTDAARERFRKALRDAYAEGASYAELGQLLGLSRQRIAQLMAG